MRLISVFFLLGLASCGGRLQGAATYEQQQNMAILQLQQQQQVTGAQQQEMWAWFLDLKRVTAENLRKWQEQQQQSPSPPDVLQEPQP